MKSIFLAVVVICALAVAGIGGTLANFADTEMVEDSAFTTGYMDLLVWDGASYKNDTRVTGEGTPSTINIMWADPGKVYTGYMKVMNAGTVDGTLYLHFKNFVCSNVEPEHCDAANRTDYGFRPEPEIVEEWGGYLDQEWVPGKGLTGDVNCELGDLVKARVYYKGQLVQLRGHEWNLLSNLESNWYELGTLDECGVTRTVQIDLMYDNIRDPNWDGTPMFKYHFTNAYMADKITFDVNFGLVSVED